MVEIWKPVKDFEGLYEVSNTGLVRYLAKPSNGYKSGLLTPFIPNSLAINYKRVHLSKNGKAKQIFVHRLVAEHFVENVDNKPFVNHIDNDPLNNNASNLEWCTQKENIQHSLKQNRRPQNTSEVMQVFAQNSRKNTEDFFKTLLGAYFIKIEYEAKSKAFVHIECKKCGVNFKTRSDVIRTKVKNSCDPTFCKNCSTSRSEGVKKSWIKRKGN